MSVMNPKEKARELVDRFYLTQYPIVGKTRDKIAKQCALFCVDEVLNALNRVVGQDESLYEEEEHWENVKTEIEQL